MKNRDYWSKPIQSDRNTQDYGNNRLGRDEPGISGWAWACAALVFAAFALPVIRFFVS